jgi:hypothetical protein
MSTKKREVIFGGRTIGAEIRAEQAREAAIGPAGSKSSTFDLRQIGDAGIS